MNAQPKPEFLDHPVAKARRQRGATKAQLAHRAQIFGRCVYCGQTFASHTLEQTLACANGRS